MRLSWSLAFNRSTVVVCNSLAILPTSLRPQLAPARTQTGVLIAITRNKKDGIKPVLFYLPWMRFERMTYRLEGGCSIQLSYQGLVFTSLYYHEHFLLQVNFLFIICTPARAKRQRSHLR